LTGQVLTENPDITTFWNVRKETLLAIKSNTPDQIDSYVDQELMLTEQCIRVNPKSYNSWFHRGWVLDQGTQIDYQKELFLCDKCLKLDDRNFHCWDYRRLIVQKANVSADKELEFSTEKIRSNFSNYSSWHYRSELLPRLYPANPQLGTCLDPTKHSEELDLIRNAIYTDPNDQSAWFYQRWLLYSGEINSTDEQKANLLPILNSELESCRELLELEPDNKWVLFQVCELLQHIDSSANQVEILQLVDKLCQVDELRRGFYNDWRSKILDVNRGKCVSPS